MAKQVLKDCSIVLDSVDISDHCSQATIETKFDLVDATSFGDTMKENLQGLGDATITLQVKQDWDAGSVDATLWPLSQSGDTFTVVIKPTSSAVGATNPSYTMTGILSAYNPIDGKAGDLAETQVTINNAGSTGIVRATA